MYVDLYEDWKDRCHRSRTDLFILVPCMYGVWYILCFKIPSHHFILLFHYFIIFSCQPFPFHLLDTIVSRGLPRLFPLKILFARTKIILNSFRQIVDSTWDAVFHSLAKHVSTPPSSNTSNMFVHVRTHHCHCTRKSKTDAKETKHICMWYA